MVQRRRGQSNDENSKKEKNNASVIFIQLVICIVLFTSFLSLRYFMPQDKDKIDSAMSRAINENISLEDLNDKMVSLTKNNETLKAVFSGDIMSVFSGNAKDSGEKDNLLHTTADTTDEQNNTENITTDETNDYQSE